MVYCYLVSCPFHTPLAEFCQRRAPGLAGIQDSRGAFKNKAGRVHAHIHARHPTLLLTLAGAMLVEASISSRKPSYTESIPTGIQQFTSHLPRKTSLEHWDPDREVVEVMLVIVVVHQLSPGTSQARGGNACSGSVLAMSPSLQPWGALSWLLCPCAAGSQAHGVPGLGNALPVCLQAVLV